MLFRSIFFVSSLGLLLSSCGDSKESGHQESMEIRLNSEHTEEERHGDHDEHDDRYEVHVAHGFEEVHEDHSSLEAHEHGMAEGSVAIEGMTIDIEILAPLANFGFAESGEAVPSSEEFTRILSSKKLPVEAINGQCDSALGASVIETEGHAEGLVTMELLCSQMPTGLEFGLLQMFEDGFEELHVILITDHGQESMELTKTRRVLELH